MLLFRDKEPAFVPPLAINEKRMECSSEEKGSRKRTRQQKYWG